MKKSLSFLIVLFCSISLNAQLLNNHWYFSNTSKGLFFDYSTNAVSVTNEHAAISQTGAGVASDSTTGAVMFYTSGAKVWDATHLVMPNGLYLNGGLSCTQTGLVCYVPGQTNRYYIFSNNADQPVPGNISFSIVDMSLQGNGDSINPKGDVDVNFKNIAITDSSSEGMTIVSGADNNFWLLIPKAYSNEIKVFSITVNGINYFNSYTTVQSLVSPTSIRYSKESGKLAIGSMIESDPVIICDFDYVNGTLNNDYIMPGSPFGINSTQSWYGIVDFEWSGNGSKLYISKYRDYSPGAAGKLYQYDLNNPTTNASLVYSIPTSQFSYIGFGLKRGPDNKIYYLYTNTQFADCRYLGIINSPDSLGTACSINATGINLGSLPANNHKFPEFLLPLHISTVVPIDTFNVAITFSNVTCNSLCNASATITATGGTSPYSYLWSNGDTSTSVSNLCVGNYTVTVIDAASDTLIQQVIITEPSALTLSVGSIQGTGCNGENSGSATVIASGGVSPYSFLWDNAAGINTSTASNLSAGSYNVVVVDSFSCNATVNLIIPAADFGTITGTVQFSIGYVGAGDGVVHLYKANVPGFYEVDSSAIFSNGTFVLNQIPAGDYFLYVKMDNHSTNPDYNIIHNTYYDSTYKWFDATILTMACNDSLNLIVNMYEKSTGNNYGNGNITGNIHYNSNNKAINGEPVPGANITLEQEPDDEPIANTSSDITGFYEFTDIAEGNYSIYIDIPGLPHVSTYSVTVSSTDTVFTNLNFVVDTVSTNPGIYEDSTVIVNYITADYSISVFPNPFAENINVRYSLKNSSNVIFELIDIEGRVIESYNKKVDSGSYNYSFKELKNLDNGIYVLKIVVDNTVYIKKLVKN